jgi:hypothetical protein
MRFLILLPMLALAACSAPGGPYPSLQPRAAERTDPRLPVERPINDRPVTGGLAARLSALVEQARSGSAAFDGAADLAEHLSAAAGPPRSESWIAAQEALTAAIAARSPATDAIGDIDEITAMSLQKNSGIAPNDFAAIQRAAAEVSEINNRQAARLAAIQRRLGQ